jgi:hypothetical protein
MTLIILIASWRLASMSVLDDNGILSVPATGVIVEQPGHKDKERIIYAGLCLFDKRRV